MLTRKRNNCKKKGCRLEELLRTRFLCWLLGRLTIRSRFRLAPCLWGRFGHVFKKIHVLVCLATAIFDHRKKREMVLVLASLCLEPGPEEGEKGPGSSKKKKEEGMLFFMCQSIAQE
jgi:hypothetical protein